MAKKIIVNEMLGEMMISALALKRALFEGKQREALHGLLGDLCSEPEAAQYKNALHYFVSNVAKNLRGRKYTPDELVALKHPKVIEGVYGALLLIVELGSFGYDTRDYELGVASALCDRIIEGDLPGVSSFTKHTGLPLPPWLKYA